MRTVRFGRFIDWQPMWAGCVLIFALGFVGVGRAADDKEKIPEPEDIALETKDGVLLHGVFFPGTNGKSTVPVIIIHDYKGQRADGEGLAKALQVNDGHAVFVVDLRGHGESVRRKTTKVVKGMPETVIEDLDAAKLKPAEFGGMVAADLPAVKKFLRQKNNEEELNIDMLCVIGIGPLGSLVAMNWAVYDWERPKAVGYKTGQDVKAMVLISPGVNQHGLKATPAVNHFEVGAKLSTMLVGGAKEADMKALHKLLKSKHAPETGTDEEKVAKRDLWHFELDADVKGAKLLDPNFGLNLDRKIRGFIKLRLTNRQDTFTWTMREDPR